MYILAAFGISRAVVSSGLGLSSTGQRLPYVIFRAWAASILLGAIAVGITVLLRRRASAMKHKARQFVPAATSTQQPQHVSYRPHAQ